MKSFLRIFLLFIVCSYVVKAQTCVVTLSDSITNPNPLPFGVNWAEGNVNRGLNALNNQTGDPGFGRQIIRIKGVAESGSSTYLDNSNVDYFETLYTGLFDGGNIRVYRETASGVSLVRSSTVTRFLADDTGPNRKRITFEPGPEVLAGDTYVLSIEANADLNQFCHPRLTWIREGANTWDKKVDDQGGLGDTKVVTKALDALDLPYKANNTTSCRISNTNANNIEVGIGQFFANDTASGEFAFDPAKRYRFGVWLKHSGIAGGKVNLRTTTSNISHTFNVTNTWQYYTHDVTGINPPSVGSPVDYLQLTFDGIGTLWVDDFTLHDLAYPLFSLNPVIEKQLADFKPHCIRVWSGQTNTDLGTNIQDWTDVELQSSRLWSVNQGPVTGAALKLPTFLPICEKHDIAPYLICSPSFSEDDFLGLMEYIYGPASSPLGAKRAVQGHPKPYNFSKIYIELGNETWNGLFDPWTYDFDGERYGKYAQHFFNIVKSSPYYNSSKIEFLLGGFFVMPEESGYGQGAVKKAPDGSQMLLANYIGGFDGLNIPRSSTFADSIQQTAFYARWITRSLIDAHITTRNKMTAAGHPYKLGIYEAGPGYALPNPSQPFDLQAEAIGKSLACGLANLDAFLYQSEKGFALQNLFLFARGFNWTSHTSEANGMRPHNHFLAMQMRNNYAKGAMIKTMVANSPTTFLPLIDADGNGSFDLTYGEAPAGNYENIAAYSFKDADKYGVFVLNRSISTTTPVTVNLPIGATMDSVIIYALTGNPLGSNIDALNYSIQTQRLAVPSKSTSYTFNATPSGIYLVTTQKSGAVTGTNDFTEDNLLKLYPNPSRALVNIELKAEGIEKIKLYDSHGRFLQLFTPKSQNVQIDLSPYPTGLYMLRIGGRSYKVIKE